MTQRASSEWVAGDEEQETGRQARRGARTGSVQLLARTGAARGDGVASSGWPEGGCSEARRQSRPLPESLSSPAPLYTAKAAFEKCIGCSSTHRPHRSRTAPAHAALAHLLRAARLCFQLWLRLLCALAKAPFGHSIFGAPR